MAKQKFYVVWEGVNIDSAISDKASHLGFTLPGQTASFK